MAERNLKIVNGRVRFITPAGKDFVVSTMSQEEAQKILDTAKDVKSSDKFDGFDIVVDNTYYFPIEKKTKRTLD